MKRVVIRTDASLAIGSGHVVRCLTLADALRQRKCEVEFICREHAGSFCTQVAQRGFRVHRLPAGTSEPEPGHWLGVDTQQDAAETQKALESSGIADWLIVDHYGIGNDWERALRTHSRRLMVIDDLADRTHEADLLLNQNLIEDLGQRYAGLLPVECERLLGPRFALLPPAFAERRAGLPVRVGRVRQLMVYFGSADHGDLSSKALEAIRSLAWADLRVVVIAGENNTRLAELSSLGRALPHCEVLPRAEDMAQLMAESDLFLGAGGATTWERCCLALPSIVVSVADNQVPHSRALGRRGAILYLGPQQGVSKASLSSALGLLVTAPEFTQSLAANSASLVDGQGTGRVADALLPGEIELRPATAADCQPTYEWRNAEVNRRHAKNPALIGLSEHERWFERSLSDPDRLLLIGSVDGTPVGVLRYDLHAQEALVSVYLVPGKHGQGHGSRLLRAGSAWLKKERPQVRRMVAEVLAENDASGGAFRNAGFDLRKRIFTREFGVGNDAGR